MRFAGARTDMPDIYRAADTVLPSTQREPAHRAIEASAAGCAVAATRVGGTPIIDDGRTGLLFEPGDLTHSRTPSSACSMIPAYAPR